MGARLIPWVYDRFRREPAVYAFVFLFILVRYDDFTFAPHRRRSAGGFFGPRLKELYRFFHYLSGFLSHIHVRCL